MYIRWKVKPRSKGEQTLLYTAYLAQNKRVEGKPHQTVTYLASIQNGQIDNPQVRSHFWQVVEERIKTLDIDSPTRTMIRTRLLERVPMVRPVQIEDAPITQETVQVSESVQEKPKRQRTKKQDEPVFTIANFASGWQPEYRCEAVQGEVKALWCLCPYALGGTNGELYIVALDWQPTRNRRKIPNTLAQKGISLKNALSDRALEAMHKAGWIQAGTTDTGKVLYKKTA